MATRPSGVRRAAAVTSRDRSSMRWVSIANVPAVANVSQLSSTPSASGRPSSAGNGRSKLPPGERQVATGSQTRTTASKASSATSAASRSAIVTAGDRATSSASPDVGRSRTSERVDRGPGREANDPWVGIEHRVAASRRRRWVVVLRHAGRNVVPVSRAGRSSIATGARFAARHGASKDSPPRMNGMSTASWVCTPWLAVRRNTTGPMSPSFNAGQATPATSTSRPNGAAQRGEAGRGGDDRQTDEGERRRRQIDRAERGEMRPEREDRRARHRRQTTQQHRGGQHGEAEEQASGRPSHAEHHRVES